MKKYFKLPIVLVSVIIISGCLFQPSAVEVEIIPDDAVSPAATTSAPAGSAVPAKPAAVPAKVTTAPAVVVTPPKQIAEIPSKFSINIAFAQQAPFGNWDEVHEETCEEASMIMIDKYLKKQALSEQIMEDELQKMLAWQAERGYKVDLTAQETVDILQQYFGIASHVSTNVTVGQIKFELSQGKPVIIPAAGQALGNPNFKQPGPIYHMLVIKGYNGSQFITNDPGTRKGNGFVYDENTLVAAIHDWNHVYDGTMTPEQMLQGRKAMVVIDL